MLYVNTNIFNMLNSHNYTDVIRKKWNDRDIRFCVPYFHYVCQHHENAPRDLYTFTATF